MPTIMIGDVKVIYSNSSAAADVSLFPNEDLVSSPASPNGYTIDVLSLSGGGAGTTIYSVDDGQINKPPPAGFTPSPAFDGYNTDLLYSDAKPTSWSSLGGDLSAMGAHIWIGSDNLIHYDATSSTDIQALAAGQKATDHFDYAIRMSNGTLAVGHITVNITGNNDAPLVTGAVTGSATEDGASSTLNALANASDVDAGTTLSVVDVPASLPAGVSYNTATHSFMLDPTNAAFQHLAKDATATVTVSYGVSDGIVTTPTPASVSWTVTGTNDAPVVTGAVTGSATEDGTSSTLNALANASDVDDGTTLSVVNVPASLPAGVSYNTATHSFTLDPTNAAFQHLAKDATATVTVNYGVSDGIATTPASASWTVTGTNDAPVVTGAVTGSATEDGTSSTLNALANASDVDDGTTLSVVNVPASLPAGVSYNAATHSFTLDPTNAAFQHLAKDATATVTVNYGVSDGIATTPASASWTVTGTNDAPVVTGAVTGSATEDGTSSTLNALANASDVDDGTTLSVVNVPAGLPGGVSYDTATHSFTLNPADAAYQHLAAGATTTVTVNYGVSDGIATTPASVSWTVTGTNDAPVAAAKTDAATEGGAVITGSVVATDPDDGASLTYSLTDASPAGLSFHADGSYSFDPTVAAYDHLAQGATQNVVVHYKANDGTVDSNVSTLTITVTGTNDAPVVTGAVTGSATEDGTSSTLNALANASDVDDGTTLSVVNVPASLPGGVSYNAATHSFTLDPTNAAFQHLAKDATATVTVNYGVSDGIATTPASASWTVTGTNDAPVVTGAVTGSATEDGTSSTLNALANASDVDDGTTLSVVNVPAGLPGGVSYDTATHSFTLNPADAAYQHLAAGATTTVTVNYGVSDGIATTPASVSWTVTGTNDAPVAAAKTDAATEGGAVITGSVVATDPDDGASLTYSLTDASPAGLSFHADGSYSFDPTVAAYDHLAQGATQNVVVHYKANDGTVDSNVSTLTITVTGTNDAPVVTGAVTGSATEDGTSSTLNALANASDVDDGTTLSVVNVPASLPAGVSYNTATHSFTLDPTNAAFQHLAKDATATVTVNYGVSDGIATTPASASWTVTGTNDAPVVTGAVTGSATEDGTSSTLNALANASDVDDGTTLSVVNVPASLPAGVSYDTATHSFTLDPTNAAFQHLAKDATATVTVNYGVSDGIATTPASVSWTVTGTNDAPVAAAKTDAATEGGAVITGSVVATDPDDGASLTYSLTDASPAGLSFHADGSYSFDPTVAAYDHLAQGATQNVVVHYKANDGTVDSNVSTLTITVTGTNDAPVVTGAVTGSATEDGTSSTLNALANASDVDDGTTLSVVNVPASLPAGVSYNAATHSFTLDPTNAAFQHLAKDATATVTVNYGVSDGIATTPASASWTVTGTNDAPVVTGAVTGSATEDGTSSTLNALANASDVDDGTTLSVVNVPASLPGGVSYDTATHSFTLNPADAAYQHLAAGATTTVTVNYGVSDGIATTPASVSWTVTGTNDAPVAAAKTDAATEGGAVITGSVVATDPDDGASLTYSLTDASPAGLSFHADGSYSFDPTVAAYDHLAQGATQNVVVHYKANDGTVDSNVSTLTITVTGTNDTPVAVNDSASITEDAVPNTVTKNAAAGVLSNDTDVDLLDTHSVTQAKASAGSFTAVNPAGGTDIAGLYGTLHINSDGSYTYSLNNSNPTVNALNDGGVLHDIFTYTNSDNHGATGNANLDITINGHADAPPNSAPTAMKLAMDLAGLASLQGADGNGATTNHDLATNASMGTFSATDPDGDPLSWSLTGTNASSFNITSSGVLKTGAATLSANTTYSFNAVADDGHGHTLSQTVSVYAGNNGSNSVTLSSNFNIAYGLGNKETFTSTAGYDFFAGGADGDTLTTGSQGGTLVGGAAVDQLAAGNHTGGGTTFAYLAASDSNAVWTGGNFSTDTRDTVTNFLSGSDKLDFTQLGHLVVQGNLGVGTSINAGSIAWKTDGAFTDVYVNLNATGSETVTDGSTYSASMEIHLAGNALITASDILHV